MAHITEIVAFQKLSSGQFVAIVRCCNNISTDWPHTMAAEVAADDIKRAASISQAREWCSQQHQSAMDAEAKLLSEVGKTVEHP